MSYTTEARKQYFAKYRSENSDRLKLYSAEYREKNRNRITERNKISRTTDNVGTFPSRMLNGARNRIKNYSARQRVMEFSITVDDIIELAILQEGKCALSKIDLVFAYCNDDTASIDRIDSNYGYTRDNIRLTTSSVNIARQQMSDEAFKRMCYNVTKANSCSSSV